MTYAVLQLAVDDARGFADLLRIYQSAIDPSEQKSAEGVRKMLDDPRYMTLTISEGGAVVGFSISFFPVGADFWLLEYMAVDKGLRSKGLGGRLFSATFELASRARPNAWCVLELDRPGAGAPISDDKMRRAAFYKKHGCRALEPLDYILPIDRAGTPPPMMLLFKGNGPHDETPAALSGAYVRELLATIYNDVYGVPVADSRFVTMVSAMPASLRLSSDWGT